MKACVIQPPYSCDTARAGELFMWKLNQLDACDDSMDIIVLPEYSDVPCVTETLEETLYYNEKYMRCQVSGGKYQIIRVRPVFVR